MRAITSSERHMTSSTHPPVPVEHEKVSQGAGRDPLAHRLGHLAEAAAFPLLTAGLILFFWLLPESASSFGTLENVQVVLATQAALVLIALAVLLPVVTNVWDFTPGATAGLASIFAASAVSSSGSIAVAVLAALGVGVAIGAVNAVLVLALRINSVIATLGMTIVISGLVQLKTDGNAIVDGIPTSLTDFGSTNLLGVPKLAIVAVVVALVVNYVLEHTPYGRRLFAIGSSRRAAGLVGIGVGRLTASTFIVGGALGGLAGMLILAQSGAGNPSVGPAFTLTAYAAVFLGAVAIRPGRWNVGGLLVAILFLGMLSSGLVLAGANESVTDFANGIALLAGVGIANVVARRRGRRVEIA